MSDVTRHTLSPISLLIAFGYVVFLSHLMQMFFFKKTQLSAIPKLNFSLLLFFLVSRVSRTVLVPNPLQSKNGNIGHDLSWALAWLSLTWISRGSIKMEGIQYVVIDTQYIETR